MQSHPRGMTTDRGWQSSSPALQSRMLGAFLLDQRNFFRGVPCERDIHAGHAVGLLRAARSRMSEVTVATLFLNGNYKLARKALPEILRATGVRVHLVTGEHADVSRFADLTSITPVNVLRVAQRHAFPRSYIGLQQAWQQVAAGDVVLLCAGPLGSILAAEWFALQPKATYLELGSFFDPELWPDGKSGALYHNDSKYWDKGCQAQCDVRMVMPDGWAKLLVARAHDRRRAVKMGCPWPTTDSTWRMEHGDDLGELSLPSESQLLTSALPITEMILATLKRLWRH